MRAPIVAAGDLACVVAFAAIGRRSHAEATSLLGVAETAWPFLLGCGGGWMVSRGWRAPLQPRTGGVVWFSTLAMGVAGRLLSGSTAKWPFVVVASLALAGLLGGWRLLVWALARRSGRVGQPRDAAVR